MTQYIVAMNWGETPRVRFWQTTQEMQSLSIYQLSAESHEDAEAIAVAKARGARHERNPDHHIRLIGVFSIEQA